MTFSSADFYRAFEDRFRGSRATIKERLKVYLPFIQPLQEKCGSLAAVDLGCGRGEWIELLTECGISAQGVDIDEGMLSECRRFGLNAHTADALAFLQGLSAESQALISGFHIAEHLPFDVLQELVVEALRVLQPGGLLILETPNPENLTVGTASFYLDPTHQRPLPPPLLAFLTEFAGFRRQKILRLQESPDVAHGGGHITLLQVLAGVSPDYAVVAQKDGPAHLIAAVGAPFSAEHGVTLDGLAHRYQQQTEALARQTEVQVQLVEAEKLQFGVRAQVLEVQMQQAEARAQQAEARAQQAEARAQQAEAKEKQAESEKAQAAQQLESLRVHVELAERRVTDLLNSRSWKLTAPLRIMSNIFLHRNKNMNDDSSKIVLPQSIRGARSEIPLLYRMALKFSKSAKIKGVVIRFSHRVPAVGVALRRIYYKAKLVDGGVLNSVISQYYEEKSPREQISSLDINALHCHFDSGRREGVNEDGRSPLEVNVFEYLQKR